MRVEREWEDEIVRFYCCRADSAAWLTLLRSRSGMA